MEEQTSVQVIGYQPMYKAYFKSLNIEWIEQYFKVEPHDLEQLDDPEGYILSKGGQIFFALYQGEVVGTVALIKNTESDYELAKMGVTTRYRGIGAGKALCAKAIEAAQEAGATQLWLESSRQLTPALRMYSQLGFVEVPMGETPYSRADIKMEIQFVKA